MVIVPIWFRATNVRLKPDDWRIALRFFSFCVCVSSVSFCLFAVIYGRHSSGSCFEIFSMFRVNRGLGLTVQTRQWVMTDEEIQREYWCIRFGYEGRGVEGSVRLGTELKWTNPIEQMPSWKCCLIWRTVEMRNKQCTRRMSTELRFKWLIGGQLINNTPNCPLTCNLWTAVAMFAVRLGPSV